MTLPNWPVKCQVLNDDKGYTSEVVVWYDSSGRPEAVSCDYFNAETFKCEIDGKDKGKTCYLSEKKHFNEKDPNETRIM